MTNSYYCLKHCFNVDIYVGRWSVVGQSVLDPDGIDSQRMEGRVEARIKQVDFIIFLLALVLCEDGKTRHIAVRPRADSGERAQHASLSPALAFRTGHLLQHIYVRRRYGEQTAIPQEQHTQVLLELAATHDWFGQDSAATYLVSIRYNIRA